MWPGGVPEACLRFGVGAERSSRVGSATERSAGVAGGDGDGVGHGVLGWERLLIVVSDSDLRYWLESRTHLCTAALYHGLGERDDVLRGSDLLISSGPDPQRQTGLLTYPDSAFPLR